MENTMGAAMESMPPTTAIQMAAFLFMPWIACEKPELPIKLPFEEVVPLMEWLYAPAMFAPKNILVPSQNNLQMFLSANFEKFR